MIDQLLKGCIKGERRYQSLFFDSYSKWAYGLCFRYLGNNQIAEEAVNDGFVKIFKNIKSYNKKKSGIKTWMSTIFIRVCIDKLRVKSESFHASMLDIEKAKEMAGQLESSSDSELFEMITQMPDGYRTIFNLYVIDGYDHNEIGQLLNIKPSSSRSQFYRGKQWLRQQIKQSKLFFYEPGKITKEI